MIDFKKLIPFKVDCKTIENSIRLQKLLFEQGIEWKFGGKYINEKIYLSVDKEGLGFWGNIRYYKVSFEDFNNFSHYSEIPIEQLLITPLKKFLKEKKK